VIDLQKLDASDTEAEERLSKNLQTVDGAMDERMRQESATRAFDRYRGATNGGGELSQRDKATDQWLRSAILEKNPAAYDLMPEEERKFTASRPGLEYRDLISSTAMQAIPRFPWWPGC
jgi:hypothetical protein